MRNSSIALGLILFVCPISTVTQGGPLAAISAPTGEYELQLIRESALGLPGQIYLLPNGDLVLGDENFGRIVRISGGQVEILATDARSHGSSLTVLPDGSVLYLSERETLKLVDPDSGEARHVPYPPQSAQLGPRVQVGPLASDEQGRIYAALWIPGRGTLLFQWDLDGDATQMGSSLPFPDRGRNVVTDLAVGQDGTVYVAGNTRVVAVHPTGDVQVVADGLNDEPVWIDTSPDGYLYINELAYRFQRYDPHTHVLTRMDVRSGFADFAMKSPEEVLFYDGSGMYYLLNLVTEETEPVFVNESGNSGAFTTGSADDLFFATPTMPPERKSHMVHLHSDGSAVEMHELAFDDIRSADVDPLGRLCLLTGEGIVRLEEDGTVHRVPLNLPPGSPPPRSLAAAAQDVWYVAASDFQDNIQVYRVHGPGFLFRLPVQLDHRTFGGNVSLDDVRVDVEEDGSIVFIAAARGTAWQGPYHQRVFHADAYGRGLREIANLDSNRIGGMVDIAAGPDGDVFVLAVVHDPYRFGWDSVFRIGRDGEVSEVIRVQAGRDPRSIDVDEAGNIWIGTTLGVFRAVPIYKD